MEVVAISEAIVILCLLIKYVKWKIIAKAMVKYNIKNNIPFSEENYTECCREEAKRILKLK